MRRNIVHPGAGQLRYEIREIVDFAKSLEKWNIRIHWENIGDPVNKGEQVSSWMKEIVSGLVRQDSTYSYVDTQGIKESREFLARQVNARGGEQISADDILFFNGLGDAVAKIFGFLKRESRILGPSPAYSTLSSAEAAHSGYDHLTYKLDPYRDWQPDLEDIENKVKYNDSIAGILLINPDNPTGAVYPRATLEKIVAIAKAYKLFVICDETYANIVFPGNETASLSEVIDGIPGIALRSISKEFPWPGARCGWIEIFNQNADDNFRDYVRSLLSAKRLEVCSTNLPQKAIPAIMGDPRYQDHLKRRAKMFASRAEQAYEAFSGIEGISIVKPKGALYFTVVFDSDALNDRQTLPLDDKALQAYITEKTNGLSTDKRFVYYLLAGTGICVVPLSGFASPLKGFRMTLLEHNDEERTWIFRRTAEAIREYLGSA
ncbi:MAG: pyridoxal phosphate-dependent aminotransferase [Spirochaetales bacterium]|nr:pyridoxal phosphate-dependent aminotransferase [Spirochaetales bacterium]